MSCKDCPLQHKKKVSPSGPPKGEIAIVTGYPTVGDATQNRPLSAKGGQFLKRTLEALGVKPADVFITFACACTPNRNKKGIGEPTAQELAYCKCRLMDELKSGGFKKILLLGNEPCKQLIPEQGSAFKCRGRATWSEELQAVLLPTIPPETIVKMDGDDYFTDFAYDLEKLVAMEPTKQATLPPDPGYTVMCKNIADVRAAVRTLLKSGLYTCDLETTGLDPIEDNIALMGIRGCLENDFHIPGRLLGNKLVIKELRKLFESDVLGTGHNITFDSKFIKTKLDISWRPKIDTMLAHYCLDERSADDDSSQSGSRNITGIHSLKTLARVRYNAPDWADTFKSNLKSKKTQNYGDADPEVLSEYLRYDTLYMYLLGLELPKEMELDGVKSVHDDILIPAAHAITYIELRGTVINQEYLQGVDDRLKLEAQDLVKQIQEFALNTYGMPNLNPNSSKQVCELLFAKMKCPTTYGTSSDKGVLVGLALTYPICQWILDFRQREKMRGTFTEGLLKKCGRDGRLRTEYLLHGTVTGRLSSRNPNLQNIPSLIGPLIRNAFVATPGWTLIEGDYSQLELRVATWLSRDGNLVYGYQNDIDIHMQVAVSIFEKPAETITSAERYIAKTVDFGIIYGRGAPSLAHAMMFERGTSSLTNKSLKQLIPEAQKYIDNFLAQYTGLNIWIAKSQKQALEKGFVQTPFNRKRRFPLVMDYNKASITRQAINSPIQSMASDMCLTALTRINNRLDPERARVLMTVHDSIMVECREGLVEETIAIMREELEKFPFESPIKFRSDFKVGQAWGTMEKEVKK